MARVIRRFRIWLPSAVLVLFSLFAVITLAQDPATNAEKIGTLEGQMRGVEKSTDSLPEQFSAMRERLIRVEDKTDRIYNYAGWFVTAFTTLIIGVFGQLAVSWNAQRALRNKEPESGTYRTLKGRK